MSNGTHNWITGTIRGNAVQVGTVNGGLHLHIPVWSRRRDANAVTAWTGPRVPDCPQAGEWEYHWHHFVVHNGARRPVHDVVVTVPAPAAELLTGEEPLMNVAVGLIPPGEQRTVEVGHHGQYAPQNAEPLEVYFRDADGRRWRRNDRGQLRRPR